MKKLSHLQKNILSMAKTHGCVSNADILTACYGFEQTSYTRAIKFDRQHIGKARYLSASAAVARSLTRLRDRGLMVRRSFFGDNVLTQKGHETVSFYPP